MGNGKLKEALINDKVKKQSEKAKQQKLQKQKEAVKSSGPKTITKEDLKAKLLAEKEAHEEAEFAEQEEEENELPAKPKTKNIKAAKKAKSDAYQSDVLSKKDQRKMKKAIQAKLGEQEDEEKVEEDDIEASDVEIAEDDDSEIEEYLLDLEKLARSDSESESEGEEDDEDEHDEDEEDDEDEDEEEAEAEPEEEAEDIPLSDVEVDSDADIVPHTKLTVNNVAALKEALARIELPWGKHSFQEHQSITSSKAVEQEIKDIYDDTERELAFYKQSLEAALEGRSKLLKLKVPFTRPQDFFAEMVKSDEHMDKLKAKLVKEASEKKASVEARRQRELKKFGKQVQNATLQERQKQKRDTLEKIKGLKRKRQNDEISGDAFDIAIEEATADSDERKEKRQKSNSKRTAKNAKYGQGGMKRFKRKNDAASSADISDFSTRKMKGKSARRPGKSKRNRG